MASIYRKRILALTWVKCAIEQEMTKMYPTALFILRELIKHERLHELKEENKEEEGIG